MIDRFSKNLTSYHWLLWGFLFLLGILFLAIFQNSNFSIIINASHNNFLDQFFKYITFLGDGRFVFLIALIYLFANKKYGISILISFIINTILIQVLKRVVFSNRFRPSFYFKNLIEDGSWNMIDGVELYEKFSFPSGHTASIFCLCMSICIFMKKKYFPLLLVLLAYIVGFSRIYLSQHFLIDVLAGALIGSLIPILTFKYIEPLLFYKNKTKD
ncbi:MAG: phosphatase PAP2 family protein [Flavobacteriales bacterium]|nr:phosphatase PAP2 family protein [Flavobacteriales bacterium]